MPLTLDDIITLGRQDGNLVSLVPGDERIRRIVRKEVAQTLLNLELQWTNQPWYWKLLDIISFRRAAVRRRMLAIAAEVLVKEND